MGLIMDSNNDTEEKKKESLQNVLLKKTNVFPSQLKPGLGDTSESNKCTGLLQ